MRYYLFLLLSLTSMSSMAQTQQWGSYFSYNNVVDITESGSKVFAASESAMFSQNTATGELKTITSVDGLKADGITALHYSNAYGRTLVGNSTGLLIVVNNDGTIATKIDIVQETTVVASKKKINHIYENNGLAYISTDFGIVVFNLATLQFGDTYYLGPSGSEIPVYQSTVYNGYIYAASGGNGIRRGLLANANLNDYSQWDTIYTGTWNTVANYSDTLFATDNAGGLYKLNPADGSTSMFSMQPQVAVKLHEANGYLLLVSASRVTIYNSTLQQVFQINTLPVTEQFGTFTCASVITEKLYVGTTEMGVYTLPLSNISSVTNITPNGPLRSAIFSMRKTNNGLYTVFGGYDFVFVPNDSRYGMSKLTTNGWVNTPYSSLSTLGEILSLCYITPNPNNNKEIYLNSYGRGLLKLVNDVPAKLYDETNSTLHIEQHTNTHSVRVNAGVFDNAGNLWIMNGLNLSPLKVLKASDGQWNEYSFETILNHNKLENEDYGCLLIDHNGTKWISTVESGLIIFNELSNKSIVVTDENGLPTNYVKSLAIDNNNRVWIGTTKGLRVINSTERFLTEDALEATQVIIEVDGVAQELMYEQTLTDIVVDGSNNKWFATASSGAYLVSPDGQQTLFHFTKENSPLPSNTINDIEIDNSTGEVFFATDRGMVSYKGTSTAGANDLSKVYVYPNPVRPGFDGDVKISGLIDNANIKITDIEGNLVYETTSEGGTVLWDTRAFGRYKVASGVYMIFISSDDATETKVKKVMVIR